MVQSFDEVVGMAGQPRDQHPDRRLHAGDRAGRRGAPAARACTPEWTLLRSLAGGPPAARPIATAVRRLPPAARRGTPGCARSRCARPAGRRRSRRSARRRRAAPGPAPGRRRRVVALAGRGRALEQRGAGAADGRLAQRRRGRWPSSIGGSHGLAPAARLGGRPLEPGPAHAAARAGPGGGGWSSCTGLSRSCGASRTTRASVTARMTEWFEEWFGEEYLQLYPHRDDAEAERAVALIVEPPGSSPRLAGARRGLRRRDATRARSRRPAPAASGWTCRAALLASRAG